MTMLERDGYCIIRSAISASDISDVLKKLRNLNIERAGSRNLLEHSWCAALAQQIRLHPSISIALPPRPVAVQCTYFDKLKNYNWLVPPHQDLSIPVKTKVNDPVLTGWSRKEGRLFVQAPEHLLQQLLAVRLHLDDCTLKNGPLRVLPGSHRYGRLSLGQTQELRTSQYVDCVLSAGDALVMRPLLLHGSSKAAIADHRRVLHFLYGPQSPGYNLQWQHAV